MANEDLDLDVESEAPKSKKKLFIIIGVVVLVLILGGVGAFVMLSGGDEPVAEETAGAEEEDDEEGDKKKADDEDEGEELADDAAYWPIEPPFVMNFEGKSRAKYMQIQLVGMSRSEKSLTAFKKHMPAIRNELTFLLGSQKFVEMVTPEGKEQLREEIIETINKIIKEQGGGRGLEKVYFTSFVMQ